MREEPVPPPPIRTLEVTTPPPTLEQLALEFWEIVTIVTMTTQKTGTQTGATRITPSTTEYRAKMTTTDRTDLTDKTKT